ncbi:polymerase cofactor VP35 [Varanus komodoensis]|nr:polymerase cofactor VP35 [Varanus komodoensis]
MKEIRRVSTQRRAFSAVAPNLWNSLPKEVRLAPSLLVFRRQVSKIQRAGCSTVPTFHHIAKKLHSMTLHKV